MVLLPKDIDVIVDVTVPVVDMAGRPGLTEFILIFVNSLHVEETDSKAASLTSQSLRSNALTLLWRSCKY